MVEEEEMMEQELVNGITCDRNEAKVTLLDLADRPGVAAGIFGIVNDANIIVDMIVQNISVDGKTTNMTFTVPRIELARTLALFEAQKERLGYSAIQTDGNVSKVSVVGVGMRSHAGVALTMFQALAKESINILVISTSEIKISVLIEEKYTELAVRALHSAYGLDAN